MERTIKADYCFCAIQKATPHSHSTHRRSHSTQSLFELQSHFKQRNKAGGLVSLSLALAVRSHNSCSLPMMRLNQRKEHEHMKRLMKEKPFFYSPSTGKDGMWWSWPSSLGGICFIMGLWTTGNVLLMHYTCIHYQPAFCTNLCTQTHTFTCTGTQTEGRREKLQWIMEWFIKIYRTELWKSHGVNSLIEICSITKARQWGNSKIKKLLEYCSETSSQQSCND